MENIVKNMEGLTAKITQLEIQEAFQTEQLKLQLATVKNGLKPSALLKSSFHAITHSNEVKHSAIDTSAGLAAGWVARKLFTLNSKNLIRKMLGYGVQAFTSSLVKKKLPALRDRH